MNSNIDTYFFEISNIWNRFEYSNILYDIDNRISVMWKRKKIVTCQSYKYLIHRNQFEILNIWSEFKKKVLLLDIPYIVFIIANTMLIVAPMFDITKKECYSLLNSRLYMSLKIALKRRKNKNFSISLFEQPVHSGVYIFLKKSCFSPHPHF